MPRHRRPRSPVRLLWLTALAALSLLLLGSTRTLSGWSNGQILNSTDTTLSGTPAFTHTYSAGPTCTASAAAPTPSCAGTLISGQVPTAGRSASDAITNNGTIPSSGLSQAVAVSSCQPVKFANTKTSSNPMVVRYGTTFDTGGGTGPMSDKVGYTTLDGASPGGYATAVVQQTQPGASLLSVGQISGVGIWFRATAGTAGPLFSFGASADNTTTGSWDRTLYLNSSGQLSFIWNSGGNSIGPTTAPAGGYADGNWHFAYVTLGGVNVVLVGLIPQVTLYVDGTSRATTPLLSLSPYSSFAGYWHLGFAPTSKTGVTSYFKGSLSDFVVFNGSSFPTATTVPTSSATFSTFATNATEWWPLNDTGTTTYTGTLPVVGAGSGTTASAACKSIDLGWTFTSPSGTASSSSTSLYTLATSGASSVSAPGPSSTQNAALALAHDAAYNSYVAGLHLWVPMTSTISTLPGNKWPLTFSWTPSPLTTIVPAP